MSSFSLLQGIFSTQELNPGLPRCRRIICCLSPVIKNLPANKRDLRDEGSILGWGRSPGEGHGNPLQYSCLENPMDRGAWQATVHGVAKNCTWLKRLNTHTHITMRAKGIIPILQVKKLRSGDSDLSKSRAGDSDPDLPEPRARSLNLYTVLPLYLFCNCNITSRQHTNFYISPPPRWRDRTFPRLQSPLSFLLGRYSPDSPLYYLFRRAGSAWVDTQSALRPHTPSRNHYRDGSHDWSFCHSYSCARAQSKPRTTYPAYHTWTTGHPLAKKGI